MSEESKYANDDRLIGTSLSRCVAEMAKNGITVREVACIVASTRIRDETDLASAINCYEGNSWRGEDKILCGQITRRLWEAGKIVQPCLVGGFNPAGPSSVSLWFTARPRTCDVPAAAGGEA